MVVFQFCGEQHFLWLLMVIDNYPQQFVLHIFGGLLSIFLKLFLLPVRNIFLDPLRHVLDTKLAVLEHGLYMGYTVHSHNS